MFNKKKISYILAFTILAPSVQILGSGGEETLTPSIKEIEEKEPFDYYRDYYNKSQPLDGMPIKKEGVISYKDIQLDLNNLTVVSNVSKEMIDEVTKNTALYGISDAIIEAEKTYGVNALFILSIVCLESGWGESRLAREKNNLTGFMAYNNDINKAKYFDSKRDNILQTTKMLSRDYLDSNGKHFNGYSAKDVNIKYCQLGNGQPDFRWYKKIERLMVQLFEDIVHNTEEEFLRVSFNNNEYIVNR